jgi:hypothetical protein
MDQKEKEERVREAIEYATRIQDYLWNTRVIFSRGLDQQIWVPLFQKRVDCLAKIDCSHPNWKVEARKRLLQQAGLSIQALIALDGDAR